PSPLPRRHPGTPSSTDAVHNTRVEPNDTRHEPSAYGATRRSSITGRIASSARPVRATDSAIAQPLNGPRGGMAPRERNHHHLATPSTDLLRSHNRVHIVVAAFDKNVGVSRQNQLQRRVLIEHHHRVDHLERRDNIHAITL